MAQDCNYRLDWLEVGCSLPCRGKVKTMNIALHQTPYWKQRGRMRVPVVIS
ncbi:rCG53518 [Rattus norvegicus]|uniref:RCG53518 n=1 Tax=Rattus norvegicus TaxID=10116 RepID=A6JRH8_RAT|nr:rCG53518 [Rattus norvegicus]